MYFWYRTAFPCRDFFSTSIVPVHDHVTEHAQQAKNATCALRVVYTHGSAPFLRRHREHAHGDRCGSHTPHRGLRSRESLQQKHTAKTLSVRGPPAYYRAAAARPAMGRCVGLIGAHRFRYGSQASQSTMGP